MTESPRTPHGERVDRLARTMCKRAGHPPETLVSQPGGASFTYDTPAGPAASRAPAAVPLWHGWRPVAVQALAALEEMAVLDAAEEKARRATVAAGLGGLGAMTGPAIGQQRANVAADVLRAPAWTTAEEQRQRANVAAQSYVQEIADGIERRRTETQDERDKRQAAEMAEERAAFLREQGPGAWEGLAGAFKERRREEAERAASLRAAGERWRGRWAAETEQAP